MAHFSALVFLMLVAFTHSSTPYRYTVESEKLITADGRTAGIRDRVGKNFVLGGLIPVHLEDPNFSGARCGDTRRDQRVEAMLSAIDAVSENKTLLPHISLGLTSAIHASARKSDCMDEAST